MSGSRACKLTEEVLTQLDQRDEIHVIALQSCNCQRPIWGCYFRGIIVLRTVVAKFWTRPMSVSQARLLMAHFGSNTRRKHATDALSSATLIDTVLIIRTVHYIEGE